MHWHGNWQGDHPRCQITFAAILAPARTWAVAPTTIALAKEFNGLTLASVISSTARFKPFEAHYTHLLGQFYQATSVDHSATKPYQRVE